MSENNKINVKGLSKQNLITVSILALALINSIFAMFGINVLPVTNEEISNIINSVCLVGASLFSTYKNFNVSTAAQTAQTLCDAIKQGAITIDEVADIIEKMKNNKEQNNKD